MKLWLIPVAALLCACGNTDNPTITDGNSTGKPDGGDSDAGQPGNDDGDDSSDDDDDAEQDPQSSGDCSDEARWIYLVDQENAFLRFEPDSGKLTKVGTLSCSASAVPFSMAVSRDAAAYVLHSDGKIFQVSTEDASCKPTSYVPSETGFQAFGMGFVSDSVGSDEETLFIASDGSSGGSPALATLDTAGWAFDKRGALEGPGELTGNGNAELWGFFPRENPMMVRQINKSTGTTLHEYDVSSIDTGLLPMPTAWAFAFWGGRYYMFYQGFALLSTSTTTSIFRLTPETGKVETVKSNIGYTIVGAGVSTCAPVTLL